MRTTLDDPEAAVWRAARLRQVDRGVLLADRRRARDGVYVAAKRRVRHPIGRPNIVERPLPERDPNQPIT